VIDNSHFFYPLDSARRIVQPCTVLTPLELRLQLGLTRAQFGKRVGASIRTVIYWEQGRTYPDVARRMRMQAIARHAGLTKTDKGPYPIRRYDPAKKEYYEGKPGSPWLDWSGQKRGSFLAARARYRKLQADIDAGRVHAQPVVALLELAP